MSLGWFIELGAWRGAKMLGTPTYLLIYPRSARATSFYIPWRSDIRLSSTLIGARKTAFWLAF